ncbi:MAG: hypothetical protein GY710_26245 [Desulfobacteraceae bacterium]|nr:hypothetical protein [Desulfobacteraceae bacterium]
MIKGLTLSLNEAGKIKIGGKGEEITSGLGNKFRPPVKFDHFKITTMERDDNGDFIVDTALMGAIKEQKSGLVNKDGELIGIPIRFLYNDPDLNFNTKYASYVRGKLSCHGNGAKALRRISDFKVQHTCPCERIKKGYEGKDKCKFSGTLTCIIDEAGLLGQAHKFRTTSENTVKSILGGIKLIKTATRGRLAGLPLMLTINPKATSTPDGHTTTIYVVSVCYRGSLADLRKDALLIGQEEQQYLIEMDVIERDAKLVLDTLESDEEAKDFASEFHPDNVGNVPEDKGVVVIEAEVVEAGNLEETTEKEIVDGEGPGQNLQKEDVKPESKEKEIIGLAPVGPYMKIYEALLIETDFNKAVAWAKRLQKSNIAYWISVNYPDVDFDSSLKKPELLKMAEVILETVLPQPELDEVICTDEKPSETNGSIDASTVKEDKPKPPPREWDNSGKIQKTQLRRLVVLKHELETSGLLSSDPIAWGNHVKYFLDADNKPINKATKLTTVQGDNFIAMLGNKTLPF